MANSAQEYIDKLYNQSQGMAGQLHEQRKQSDDEVIQQINAAIDRATASSTNPYKTQMEQLPSQYQSLFDANAVQELVGRRQVQEAMANMGLTDSGLNRTQQTALSVQRGNADASVRLAQQQRPRSSRTRYPSSWRTRRHKTAAGGVYPREYLRLVQYPAVEFLQHGPAAGNQLVQRRAGTGGRRSRGGKTKASGG